MSLPVTDPVLIVAIAMLAFLVMPLLTERLRVPDIIGILLAGVLVGPHGLGFLARDQTIQLLGTVGLLYLVFLAGLEVDLADLKRTRRRALSFGFITFLVPQVIGTVGALLLFDDFSFSKAVLLGSVFSSHSFLALLIAKRMRLTERESVIAVIGGTVITDTLALFVLAVVAQTASGDFGVGFMLQLLAQTVVFALAVIFGLPLLGRWFFRRFTDGGAHFSFMLTMLFTCGYLAHVAGLEPIIGAFLAGLAMNRLIPHHGALANRAFFFGNTFFVPFFLLSVGMLIDLQMVVSDLPTIKMAIFMTVTVTVCKGLAAWIMRLLFGYRRDEVAVAWGLSLPQAATTLAVVLVGHELQLFDDAILNATIVMVLVTCIVGPLLVQIAGRRLAAAAVSDAPTDPATGPQRILIPLANPQSSMLLLDLAIALRRPLSDQPLLPVSVAAHKEQVAQSEHLLADCVLHAAAADVPVLPVIRVDMNPAGGILRAVHELRASCLVVGWSGPKATWQRHFHLARGLIDELIEETTTQLLVVRLNAPVAVIKRVFMAVPRHAASERGYTETLADCKSLCKRLGAPLTVVGAGAASEPLQEEISATGTSCPISFEDLGSEPAALASGLAARLTAADLLILIGCRPGTASWESGWSRLPTRIAHLAPAAALIVAFPRLEDLPIARPQRPATDRALLQRAVVHMAEGAEDLRGLVATALTGFSFSAQQKETLISSLSTSISGLDVRVGFTHSHSVDLSQPQLSVCLLRKPVLHEGLELRVLLVLLNPPGVAAEEHLGHLASLAALTRDAARIDALLQAADAEQARKILSGD